MSLPQLTNSRGKAVTREANQHHPKREKLSNFTPNNSNFSSLNLCIPFGSYIQECEKLRGEKREGASEINNWLSNGKIPLYSPRQVKELSCDELEYLVHIYVVVCT